MAGVQGLEPWARSFGCLFSLRLHLLYFCICKRPNHKTHSTFVIWASVTARNCFFSRPKKIAQKSRQIAHPLYQCGFLQNCFFLTLENCINTMLISTEGVAEFCKIESFKKMTNFGKFRTLLRSFFLIKYIQIILCSKEKKSFKANIIFILNDSIVNIQFLH